MTGRGFRQRHRAGRRRLASRLALLPRPVWAAAALGLFLAGAGSPCGNSFAIFSDGRGSGTGNFTPRPTRTEALRHQHHEMHGAA